MTRDIMEIAHEYAEALRQLGYAKSELNTQKVMVKQFEQDARDLRDELCAVTQEKIENDEA